MTDDGPALTQRRYKRDAAPTALEFGLGSSHFIPCAPATARIFKETVNDFLHICLETKIRCEYKWLPALKSREGGRNQTTR